MSWEERVRQELQKSKQEALTAAQQQVAAARAKEQQKVDVQRQLAEDRSKAAAEVNKIWGQLGAVRALQEIRGQVWKGKGEITRGIPETAALARSFMGKNPHFPFSKYLSGTPRPYSMSPFDLARAAFDDSFAAEGASLSFSYSLPKESAEYPVYKDAFGFYEKSSSYNPESGDDHGSRSTITTQHFGRHKVQVGTDKTYLSVKCEEKLAVSLAGIWHDEQFQGMLYVTSVYWLDPYFYKSGHRYDDLAIRGEVDIGQLREFLDSSLLKQVTEMAKDEALPNDFIKRISEKETQLRAQGYRYRRVD